MKWDIRVDGRLMGVYFHRFNEKLRRQLPIHSNRFIAAFLEHSNEPPVTESTATIHVNSLSFQMVYRRKATVIRQSPSQIIGPVKAFPDLNLDHIQRCTRTEQKFPAVWVRALSLPQSAQSASSCSLGWLATPSTNSMLCVSGLPSTLIIPTELFATNHYPQPLRRTFPTFTLRQNFG